MQTSPSSEHYWLRQATIVCLQSNLAWCLSIFVPGLASLSLIFFLLVVLAKRSDQYYSELWYGLLSGAILLLVISYFLVRRRFFSTQESLVQIEIDLKLNNRLSCAQLGLCTWPRAQALTGRRHFSLRKLAPFILTSFIFLFAAALFPINPRSPTIGKGAVPPLSISEVEELVEKLEQQNALNQERIDEIKKELSDFNSQPKENWFEHNSLEAADNLNEKTKQSIESLLGALADVNNALNKLANENGNSDSNAAAEQSNLGQALKKMESSALLDPRLAQQLGKLSKEGAQALSQSELSELRQKLEKLQNDLDKLSKSNSLKSNSQSQTGKSSPKQGNCSGSTSEEGGMCTEDTNSTNKSGTGDGESDSSDELGQGGTSRGPGTAPLELKEKAPQITSNRTENDVSSENQPEEMGELLGLGSKKPESGPVDKGSAAGVVPYAADGKAVFKGNYTPEEEGLLEKFFN